MHSASPRQQLLEEIAKLSDHQLQVVLQFIQTLQPKPILPDTPIDPLANFIGATNHGNLAQAINETLYE